MTLKKTLLSIVVIGALISVFDIKSEFSVKAFNYFNGKINEEEVIFKERVNRNFYDILTVKRKDGTIIKYIDYNCGWCRFKNHSVDELEITKNSRTESYTDDDIGKYVLKEAQRQYDNYLAEILKIQRENGLKKREEGLKSIKRN